MISKYAVKQFLNRELDSWDWIKEHKKSELKRTLDLPEGFKFHTTPFTHQLATFLIGTVCKEFLFFADMGFGKSKLSLDLFKYYKLNNQAKRVLVLVPYNINVTGWEEEIERHAPDLKYSLLNGTTDERWEEIKRGESEVYVIPYQGLIYLCSTKKKNKKGKMVMRMDRKKIDELSKHFDMVVADECQNLKNQSSLPSKIVSRLKCPIRYGLTGTPFGRDPQDLWSQFNCIDGGETLGATIGLFRAVFFEEKDNYWGGKKYTLPKTKEKDLYQTIKHRSIRYNENELNDLPKKVYQTVTLPFPEDSLKIYQELVAEIKALGMGKKVERKNAFIKMRQICSGFVKVDVSGDNEDPDVIDYEFKNTPKIEALISKIEEMPRNAKMVVFHDFIYSGNMISRELTKAKIQHVHMGSAKDKGTALKKFTRNKECRVLVINSKTGSTGLNLQAANYVLFYESPVSPITRAQAEKRCHREGQRANRVYFIDFVTKNSVEEKILEFIKEGRDLLKTIIDGKEQWLY